MNPSVLSRLVALPLLFAATAAFAADPPAAAPSKGAAAKEVPQPVHPAQVAASTAEAVRLSDAFVAVADKVSDSVVQINVTARDENSEQIMRFLGRGGADSPVARGTGSGVVFTADGAILTNNHVIEEALTINVQLHDGRQLPAKLVGRDPQTDLAVIKVDATGLSPAKFADSDAARVGQWAVAIGSPYGLSYSVTAGILSAKGRGVSGEGIEDYLQTDASINPGNSGGPLCDLDGKVLGINTAILGGRNGGGGFVGFAIPSNMARHVAEQILKNGHVTRPSIGVITQGLTPDLAAAFKLDTRAGALVDTVVAGSPAEKANVRPGDVIAAVSGRPTHDSLDLMREVLDHDVGQTVQLEIIREGKHYRADVTLGAREEKAPDPIPAQAVGVPHAGLGIAIRDVAPSEVGLQVNAKTISVITRVEPGSPADRAQLKQGDVIVHADGAELPSSDQVAKAANDGNLLLRVTRKGRAFYAALHK
jgi:Do/DeqQ family serine protease